MQQYRRSGALFWLLSIAVLVVAAMTVSPTQAQTTSVGPYYATPSWDQTLPAATRFIVLSNFESKAVLDRNTGLVWEKNPFNGLAKWDTGIPAYACANNAVGGQKGWRLPSFQELASLIDPTQFNPSPPASHPFREIQQADYWSATTVAANPVFAWTVHFGSGNVGYDYKDNSHYIWCVRGGMNADAY